MAKKTHRARLKELREKLHYFQGQAETEERWLKESIALCKKIGAEMRVLQKEINEKKKATIS